MIPIPNTAKQKLIDWLPKTLAGTTYQFIETQRNIPRPEVPAIIVYFSAVGSVSRGSNSLLRTVRTINGVLDDSWGQYHHATLTVTLRANDADELSAMHESFIRQIFSTRRDLSIRTDKVQFLEVLRSESLPIDYQRNSAQNEAVFSGTIDLRFEYEMSDVSTAEAILRVHNEITVTGGEPDSMLSYTTELFNRELTCGIVANIIEHQ